MPFPVLILMIHFCIASNNSNSTPLAYFYESEFLNPRRFSQAKDHFQYFIISRQRGPWADVPSGAIDIEVIGSKVSRLKGSNVNIDQILNVFEEEFNILIDRGNIPEMIVTVDLHSDEHYLLVLSVILNVSKFTIILEPGRVMRVIIHPEGH